MSSYKNYCLILLISFVFLACTNKKQIGIDKKIFEQEDELIVHALEYEQNRLFDQSSNIYLTLFNITHRDIYMTKSLKILLEQKKYKKIVSLAKKHINNNSSQYQNIMRMYIIALLNLKQNDLALENGLILIKKFNNPINYEIIADIYYQKKSYKKSVQYLESSYILDFRSQTLLKLVNILYVYLNDKKKAISFLETHSISYKYDLIVDYKLLSIYQEQKDLDGIISVLKRIYFTNKKNEDLLLMQKSSEVLVYYLEKKSIQLAIEFLKTEKSDDNRLLILYKQDNQIKNALNLVVKIYKKSPSFDLLAQIAILEFENEKNKKRVIKSVIKKLKRVLQVLDNHIYQNYLGYLLINYDINIKEGLIYVQKALKKAPDNISYIDSLAWGQYKLKNCKQAYVNIQKVVHLTGLNNKEIKLHWKKIKECLKNDFR